MSRFNSVILFNCLSLRLRQSLPSNSPQFGGTESGVLHVRSNQLNLISVEGIQFSLKDAPNHDPTSGISAVTRVLLSS